MVQGGLAPHLLPPEALRYSQGLDLHCELLSLRSVPGAGSLAITKNLLVQGRAGGLSPATKES